MWKKLLLLAANFLVGTSIVFAQQKTDVWDFGASQLNTETYINKLTETTINAWYSVAPGTSNITLPTGFVAGELMWTGGTNDRLRTSNLNLTRYDNNLGAGLAAGYTGRLYVNATAAVGRFFTLTLNEDDEVTIVANSDANGLLNFVYETDPTLQTEQVATTVSPVAYKFVAKNTGKYKIFESISKPSYYQIQRKAASYTAVSGEVTASGTALPTDFSLRFTNEAGKTWTAPVTNGKYSLNLPVAHLYKLALGNANGYVITEGETLQLAATSATHNVTLAQVNLHNVSGKISGLSAESEIENLSLVFTPDGNVTSAYQPKPVINAAAATYSVNLEENTSYTVSARGVNDDEILNNKLTIAAADLVSDITFSAKLKFTVAIKADDLNSTQLNQLKVTFTNINEAGYQYTFTDLGKISLRNGTYSVLTSGLDEFPLEMKSTSFLTINNNSATKELKFLPVQNWSFDDKVITSATPFYKGLAFSGNILNEILKGHLVAQSGASLAVPVNPGEKLVISYYYAANFSFDNSAAIVSSSGSTSKVETAEYIYQGTSPGNIIITTAGLTYFTNIAKTKVVAYSPVLTVGSGKDFSTINEALTAISQMVRTSTERVTVLIDPGNYEEMLVIKDTNITLKNASATPSIDLANKGVDIEPNAVRITSYYGVGYNYYSQGSDNKWNADALEINKANGFTNYTNVSGTTNGSYWNATVVISADNFEAENIIFENSFNQYISAKEANDVLVNVGTKGERPKIAGDVSVQNKSFVERAAALAVANNTDKVFLKNCRVVGRQDSFFGGTNARVAVYKGVMMGAVDYIFGPMTAVFYQTKFAMNTSDVAGDISYLTAPQQLGGRGFLLYECTIGSADPGTETASAYRAKPGFFGRPWAATTGEAVIYKATVETSDFPGAVGSSLIAPAGWLNTLSGTSDRVYEYQSIELSGVNNAGNRESWSKVLTTPFLPDGTEITLFNFTKGNDNWDPFKLVILAAERANFSSSVKIFSHDGLVYVTQVKAPTAVKVYGMNGALTKIFSTKSDLSFRLPLGVYIVTAESSEGLKSVKLLSK
jgi:exo-poly-alpha-galacturonosidase